VPLDTSLPADSIEQALCIASADPGDLLRIVARQEFVILEQVVPDLSGRKSSNEFVESNPHDECLEQKGFFCN
jgi:hypothetical protein